jgi:hypothetical protein
MEHLAEMFHGIVVDGSSSCIPGSDNRQSEEVYEEEGDDGDGEGFLNSTPTSSSRKRASSTTDTTTSPPKKGKSSMIKVLEGIINEMQTSRTTDTEVFTKITNTQQNRSTLPIEEIESCLNLAEASGADKASDEYFVATKLFRDDYNRAIFNQFDTADQRFKWLQRWCREYYG